MAESVPTVQLLTGLGFHVDVRYAAAIHTRPVYRLPRHADTLRESGFEFTPVAFFFPTVAQRRSRRVLARLCRARDLLRADHGRSVSIEEAAREAALSRYHFIRRFRAVFGETPHQVLMAARLSRAKKLLIVSHLSVTEICVAVGFSSVGTFSHEFSRRVGSSPKAYREQFGKLVKIAGMLPPQLAPGCLSLMSDWPQDAQFPRSPAAPVTPHSVTSMTKTGE